MKSPQKNKTKSPKSKAVKPAATPKVQRAKAQPKAYNEEVSEAFIKEVNEEVQNDNLKALWDKYGLFVILFVFLAVFAAVSFDKIKDWRDSQFQSKTESYLTALQNAGDPEKSLAALEKIANGDYGKYSELARIQIANILFENGRDEEAVKIVEAIVSNDELSPNIKNPATLKLVTYKFDTASRSEIENLLLPIAQSDNSWAPLAQEMLAMTAIRDGDIEQARAYYEQLLQNSNISANLKSRVEDMLSSLNEI